MKSNNSTFPLHKSPFSAPFNTLYYLGAWATGPLKSRKLTFYFFYQVFITFLAFSAILSLLFDLYQVSDNFVKITWNLCISTLWMEGVIKNIYLYLNYPVMARLRSRLHRDMIKPSRAKPEYQPVHQEALREFRFVRFCMYLVYAVGTPIWLFARAYSSVDGERTLPIPIRLPIDINGSDDFNYRIVYGVVTVGSTLGLFFVVESEVVMYSLLIQISREYNMLLRVDIPKLNEEYDTNLTEHRFFGETIKENMKISNTLLKTQTKTKIMKIARRQRELIEYTKDFETCYNKIMLVEIFAVSILLLVSSIQGLLMSERSLIDLIYQVSYMSAITFHTFVVCSVANRITDQCYAVGVNLYDTNWYLMDIEVQKEIILILLRAQNPPRVTAGRVMDLNVNAFMNVMKNIYSWVTLFRQLEIR